MFLLWLLKSQQSKKTTKSAVFPAATQKSTVKAKGDTKHEASLVANRKLTIKATKGDSKSITSPVTTHRVTAKNKQGYRL